jgi:Na+/proline symporter
MGAVISRRNGSNGELSAWSGVDTVLTTPRASKHATTSSANLLIVAGLWLALGWLAGWWLAGLFAGLVVWLLILVHDSHLTRARDIATRQATYFHVFAEQSAMLSTESAPYRN